MSGEYFYFKMQYISIVGKKKKHGRNVRKKAVVESEDGKDLLSVGNVQHLVEEGDCWCEIKDQEE